MAQARPLWRPAAPAPPAAPLRPVALPQWIPNRMPGRILILDDDVTRRITLAARLSGAFYEIRLADTLEEALAQVAEWQPAMLLVADDLARAPAAGVLRRLRATPRLAEAALLVVTVPGAHMGRSDLLVAGADDVIARSEPQEVFQARLRSHDRARELLQTLKPRGAALSLPGLAEGRARFRTPTRVTVLAPEPDSARAWQTELTGAPGFRIEFRDLSSLRDTGSSLSGRDPAGSGRATGAGPDPGQRGSGPAPAGPVEGPRRSAGPGDPAAGPRCVRAHPGPGVRDRRQRRDDRPLRCRRDLGASAAAARPAEAPPVPAPRPERGHARLDHRSADRALQPALCPALAGAGGQARGDAGGTFRRDGRRPGSFQDGQ